LGRTGVQLCGSALHFLHPCLFYAFFDRGIETVDEKLGELGAVALLELESFPEYLVT
jgi:hypothetical protein